MGPSTPCGRLRRVNQGTPTIPTALKGLLAAAAFLAPLAFLTTPGTFDIAIWKHMAGSVTQYGWVEGYREGYVNYPPFGVLMMIGAFGSAAPLGISEALAFKISLFAALSITSFTYWAITRNMRRTALLHWGLTLNSVALGYIDVYFAPTLLLAYAALKQRRLGWATVFMTLTCLIKWQSLLLAPFVLIHVLEARQLRGLSRLDFKRLLLQGALPFILLVAVAWGMARGSLWYSLTLSLKHRMLSGNALNFNWIYTYLLHVFAPDRFGPLIDGAPAVIKTRDPHILLFPKTCFYGCYLFALGVFFTQKKTFANLLTYSIAGYMVYFTFNSGVHENHLFPAALVAMLFLPGDTTGRWRAWLLMAALNVNMLVFYGIRGDAPPFGPIAGVDLTVLLAVACLALFGWLYRPVIQDAKSRLRLARITHPPH